MASSYYYLTPGILFIAVGRFAARATDAKWANKSSSSHFVWAGPEKMHCAWAINSGSSEDHPAARLTRKHSLATCNLFHPTSRSSFCRASLRAGGRLESWAHARSASMTAPQICLCSFRARWTKGLFVCMTIAKALGWVTWNCVWLQHLSEASSVSSFQKSCNCEHSSLYHDSDSSSSSTTPAVDDVVMLKLPTAVSLWMRLKVSSTI